jgi:signal transduction histidine kinase
VLNRLHTLLGAKPEDVAADQSHELHTPLMIVSLHQQLMQCNRDKFIGTYYVDGQNFSHRLLRRDIAA